MNEYATAAWNFIAHTAPGVLLALILGDILTGILKAAGTGQVSSDISRAGMARKVGMLIGVAVAHVLETFSGQPLAAITAICFSISEFISLVENLGALGVRFPPAVTRYFRQLATSAGVDARQLDEPSPSSTAANPAREDREP